MKVRLTPDGHRYIAARPPSPFHLRWLVPLICRGSALRWLLTARVSIAVYVALVAVLAAQRGVQGVSAVAAAVLVAGLPSTRLLWRWPVLVDAPALMFSVASAVTVRWPLASVAFALLGGATSERSPLFAALFAWNPLPLVGLAVPLVTGLTRRPGEDVLGPGDAWILKHPILASRKHHRPPWLPLLAWPWGGCLLAVFNPSWGLAVVLLAAYGQLLVATDSARLYQWAAPVVAVAAAAVVPWPLLPAVLLFHWVNPWAGDGV